MNYGAAFRGIYLKMRLLAVPSPFLYSVHVSQLFWLDDMLIGIYLGLGDICPLLVQVGLVGHSCCVGVFYPTESLCIFSDKSIGMLEVMLSAPPAGHKANMVAHSFLVQSLLQTRKIQVYPNFEDPLLWYVIGFFWRLASILANIFRSTLSKEIGR